jgi:hypothetical protein
MAEMHAAAWKEHQAMHSWSPRPPEGSTRGIL